ncbi:hypothetical protein B0H13DRAFT_2498256 [Mycena leptocephala]|nr:hypothetical protein B0H13DRAFT_2498256 [Mycena leptocephala]
MPNPVDDATVGPGGKIAPPVGSDASDRQPDERTCLRRSRRKLFHVLAVCFPLAVGAFWKHPLAIGRLVNKFKLNYEAPTSIADDPRLEPFQTPENAAHCAEWMPGSEPNSAFTSLELPSTRSDFLFFISRGPVSGHINIIETDQWGHIDVYVTAQYQAVEDLERTKVCLMGSGLWPGVLFWAEPRHPHGDPKRDVRFSITVALRQGYFFKDLTTDLPLFSHSFGDFSTFWSPLMFKVIRLKTSNAAITLGKLSALSAFIQTSNAPLNLGFFDGIELIAQTSNAPIYSSALMRGEPGSDSRINFKTSNGPIHSNLGIFSEYNDTILSAVLRTSDASLYISTPLRMYSTNASFFLDASTSVGPAIVKIYPDYEGTYDLHAFGAVTQVEIDPARRDPLWLGRFRTVTKTSTGEHA